LLLSHAPYYFSLLLLLTSAPYSSSLLLLFTPAPCFCSLSLVMGTLGTHSFKAYFKKETNEKQLKEKHFLYFRQFKKIGA